ncbi:MAG TPA: cyclic nucleotide-binding domain-containing protein [Thermoleophilaceae bacterium]|jgi:cAMP-dependent protein kinase regulator|nr:cyclic nucleotide-binding domain-containing protein [Thermoleophilaceae bacterium]
MRPFSHDTKVDALRTSPLFEGLSKKELAEVAQRVEDMELEPGAVLCREGEIGQEFFVIIEGEVEVERRGQDLGTRGAGDFIGEIALLEEIERTATVTAKTPLRVMVLTRPGFKRLVEQHPGVELKVLRTLARRVAAMSEDPKVA